MVLTADMGCKSVYKWILVAFVFHICNAQQNGDDQGNHCAPLNPLDDDNCLDEELCVNYKRGEVPQNLDYFYEKYGIQYEHTSSPTYEAGKFEAAFDDLPRDFNGSCFNKPTCADTQCKRRMLRIDIHLKRLNRCSGPVFDIFNYYKYYGGYYYYGAKAYGFNPEGLYWYTSPSGCCYHNIAHGGWPTVFKEGTRKIRIYVAHNYLRVITDQGFDRFMCDSCLFNLNNCDDTQRFRQKLHILINTCYSKFSDYKNGMTYPYGDCVNKVCLKWETCACDSAWVRHEPDRRPSSSHEIET